MVSDTIRYVDQVAIALEVAGRTIGMVAASGPDTARTLTGISAAG